MNIKTTVVLIFLAIFIGGAGVWAYMKNNSVGDTVTPPSTMTSTPPVQEEDLSDLIQVTEPAKNATITSPITVKGKARGTWYFEASFPVTITDANGVSLGVVPAQAKGDWMTTDFVPFEATVSFTIPTTPTGFIVFEKDNPSGLPQNAKEYKLPIKF